MDNTILVQEFQQIQLTRDKQQFSKDRGVFSAATDSEQQKVFKHYADKSLLNRSGIGSPGTKL